MPYSRDAKYYHIRQIHPSKFAKDSFKTVPISHTDYSGKKYAKKGIMAIVGKMRRCNKYCWKVQSILVPKQLKIK